MKNVITMEARRFPVTVRDTATGKVLHDEITLTKEQLHAAQMVQTSSKELIHRLYDRQGYEVQEIGKAEKRTIEIDVGYMWDMVDFVKELEEGGRR